MHKKQWICAIVTFTLLLSVLSFAGCRREDPTQPALDSKPAPTPNTMESQVPTEPAPTDPTEPAPEGPTIEMTEPTDPTTDPTHRETRPTDPVDSTDAPTELPTQPEVTEPEVTEPQVTQPIPTDPPGVGISYGDYLEMSEEEQEAFFLSFADPQDFFDWQTVALKEYNETKNDIEVGGDATFDMGDIP